METIDNPFIRRQLEAAREAERDIICLYAESCFLNIQIVLGNLCMMDRLERLSDALTKSEQRLQLSRAALRRVGVPAAKIPDLSEQERLELFETHFRDPNASSSFLRELFERSDLQQMLDDICYRLG